MAVRAQDWLALLIIAVIVWAASVLALAGAINLPFNYAILMNAAGFVLSVGALFLALHFKRSQHGLQLQPAPGDMVSELVGSALQAYGLKGETQ